MVSALGTLKRPVSDLKAEKLSFKELDQDLMQKAFLSPHKSTEKSLPLPSGTFPTGMLGIPLELDQRLASSLARELSELCSDGDILTCN